MLLSPQSKLLFLLFCECGCLVCLLLYYYINSITISVVVVHINYCSIVLSLAVCINIYTIYNTIQYKTPIHTYTHIYIYTYTFH